MDIGLREWLIIGGVILILLIIFDGWRRMQSGRNRLKLNIDKNFVDVPVEDESFNPELPGGGARRVGLDDDPLFSNHRPELSPLKDESAAIDDDLAVSDKAETQKVKPSDAPIPSQTANKPLGSQDLSCDLSLDEGIVSSARKVVTEDVETETLTSTDVQADLEPPLAEELDTYATSLSGEGVLGPARVVTVSDEPEPEPEPIEADPVSVVGDCTLDSKSCMSYCNWDICAFKSSLSLSISGNITLLLTIICTIST
jgi:FtsZ-interacting cell division protein ZipA